MEDIPFGEESTSQQPNQDIGFDKYHKHKHHQESESKFFSEEDR